MSSSLPHDPQVSLFWSGETANLPAQRGQLSWTNEGVGATTLLDVPVATPHFQQN
jgi:hypothetical protein